MAGATAAKYLRLWGGSGVQVTLVEKDPAYTSCILSNLVLTDSVAMSSLAFNWDRLRAGYGVGFVAGTATAIDAAGRKLEIATAGGSTTLAYDRLVLAPGIEFDYSGIEGLANADDATRANVPHAWKAGPQTLTLRQQLHGMRPGGTMVMTIPRAPYRCPPGPYERACLIADWLRERNPTARLIVLDANNGPIAEPESFRRAFAGLYGSLIDYRPNVTVVAVDPATRVVTPASVDGNGAVTSTLPTIATDVVNVIPPHRAPALLREAGLTAPVAAPLSTQPWALVEVLGYESTKAQGVHVIGDAASTTQPKAGHIANQEAKVCADAIVRMLAGRSPDPSPVTNSACYSPITRKEASWLTVVFSYDAATKRMVAVPGSGGEAPEWKTDHFEEMFAWFRNLMSDSYA